jgi:hypothetical protein
MQNITPCIYCPFYYIFHEVSNIIINISTLFLAIIHEMRIISIIICNIIQWQISWRQMRLRIIDGNGNVPFLP